MKKILYIVIIAVTITLTSQVVRSPYVYVINPLCSIQDAPHLAEKCYGLAAAKGYPLGFSDIYVVNSGFDDFNLDFGVKNLFLNFAFYYVLISCLIGMYNILKKEE